MFPLNSCMCYSLNVKIENRWWLSYYFLGMVWQKYWISKRKRFVFLF